MKSKMYAQRPVIIALTISLFFACKKSLQVIPIDPVIPPNAVITKTDSLIKADSVIKADSIITQQTPTVPFPEVTNYNCNGPDYGDSIIYPQPVGLLQSYIVSPVNNPGPGKYYSWPIGLVINENTGAINVTQSETGQRYSIGFVKAGTQDTCLKTIIIAGAAYADAIYVLENGETTASPYFNANPNITSVCTSSGPGSGCQWDVGGLAKLQGIRIDNQTGVIDLQKSLNGGLFGLLPVNGLSVQSTISYKLSDNSNLAAQKTPVKLIFYNKKSDIPQSLLDDITNKRTNILDQVLILLGGNPRPPLIIITRYN